MRPSPKLFAGVDSFLLNFSKALLLGVPGNLFYVADRAEITRAFDSDLTFVFLKNRSPDQSQSINYKDWSFGLARRFNSLKFFFLFRFYGLNRLREFLRTITKRREAAVRTIQQSGILSIFAKPRVGLVCFQLLDRQGRPDSRLTRILAERVRDIPEGFMSPGDFREYYILRLAIGNYNSTDQTIQRYLNRIIEVGHEIRAEDTETRAVPS